MNLILCSLVRFLRCFCRWFSLWSLWYVRIILLNTNHVLSTATGWCPGSPCVDVSYDDLWVLVDDDAWEGESSSNTAKSRQLVPKQQLGQQQVPHHIQVAQDVQRDSGGQGDDTAAGQVVKHWAQTAEQDETPEVVVILERGLQRGPVLQNQGGDGQDAEAGDGHQIQ